MNWLNRNKGIIFGCILILAIAAEGPWWPWVKAADVAVKDMTEDTSPSATDIYYEVKDPSGSPLDRKVTAQTIAGLPVYTTIQTGTTYTFGTTTRCEYVFNNQGSNGTYTLPTAAAGLQFCIKNYTSRTSRLKIQTSASGQYIDLDGTNSASGGYIQSAGAEGDGCCVVGVDATHWVAYPSKGTWTRDS